ncbi:hypothetical protein GALMADRAFT_213111 [Galerina marginata CBS 339.88]|uniref:Uncharacterized protein n=1 Tax=Galerina marginata (strain CBS 339.88) TaxID=685588 RepID=A0A067SRB1_GALM3|nr:hypothetical protein GALMADRAFT_213111 [Galerina marginata CBS 339.88]
MASGEIGKENLFSPNARPAMRILDSLCIFGPKPNKAGNFPIWVDLWRDYKHAQLQDPIRNLFFLSPPHNDEHLVSKPPNAFDSKPSDIASPLASPLASYYTTSPKADKDLGLYNGLRDLNSIRRVVLCTGVDWDYEFMHYSKLTQGGRNTLSIEVGQFGSEPTIFNLADCEYLISAGGSLHSTEKRTLYNIAPRSFFWHSTIAAAHYIQSTASLTPKPIPSIFAKVLL